MRGSIRLVIAVVVGAAVAATLAAPSAFGRWAVLATLGGIIVVIVAGAAAVDAWATRAFRRTMRDDFVASGRVGSAEEFDELVCRHGTLGAVDALRDDGR